MRSYLTLVAYDGTRHTFADRVLSLRYSKDLNMLLAEREHEGPLLLADEELDNLSHIELTSTCPLD